MYPLDTLSCHRLIPGYFFFFFSSPDVQHQSPAPLLLNGPNNRSAPVSGVPIVVSSSYPIRPLLLYLVHENTSKEENPDLSAHVLPPTSPPPAPPTCASFPTTKKLLNCKHSQHPENQNLFPSTFLFARLLCVRIYRRGETKSKFSGRGTIKKKGKEKKTPKLVSRFQERNLLLFPLSSQLTPLRDGKCSLKFIIKVTVVLLTKRINSRTSHQLREYISRENKFNCRRKKKI